MTFSLTQVVDIAILGVFSPTYKMSCLPVHRIFVLTLLLFQHPAFNTSGSLCWSSTYHIAPMTLLYKDGKDSSTYYIVICILVRATAAHGIYMLSSPLRHTLVPLFITFTKLVCIMTLGTYAPTHRVL